jgi:hypothetical protein
MQLPALGVKLQIVNMYSLIKPSGINSFLFIKIKVAQHQVSLKMTEEQRVVE